MLKSNKGITMSILVITLIVIMVITSTVVGNAADYIRIKTVNNIETDISLLMERIPLYYKEHGTLPIKSSIGYEQTALLRSNANVNDDPNEYYEIDLSLLPDLRLYNGYKEHGMDDFYCINAVSLVVYYMPGIEIKPGEIYYTIQEGSSVVPSTIEGPQFLDLRAISVTDRTVTVEADFLGATSYQFQVDGEDWSEAQSARSMTFVNLTPNTVYTFRVRGIAADGSATLGYKRIMTAYN